MNEVVIRLKTVTPIFIGGATARDLAETIRPASIRGQVRYWLRAMLGRAGPTIAELKAREGALLGDTQVGSPVRFRVRPIQALEYVLHEPQARGPAAEGRMMLPHRAVDNRQNPLASDAYLEEQQFDLVLTPRPGLHAIPPEVLAATLLWMHLGGIGKRSRRGFGSLQPVGYEDQDGLVSEEARKLLSNKLPADASELQTQIKALLSWAAAYGGSRGSFTGLSEYSILHEEVAGVRVSEAVTGYELDGYHQAMVPFWKESLREIGAPNEKAFGYAIRDRRRASPFHLHISQTGQGYHLVLTTFWARPSPDNAAGWKKVADLLDDCDKRFYTTNVWGRAS